MQSKFWAAGSASSGSEESSVETEEEIVETKRVIAAPGRWAIESSSSEDEKRVVKSLKDRRWSDMREIIKQMNNHMKISDYSELYKDYETLLKCISKSYRLIETEGYPNFFIRTLCQLECFLEDKHKDKEAFKKLSKAKAIAFNSLRAKVRKSNEEWRQQIEKCYEDASKFASSEESESERMSESEDSCLSDEEESEEEKDKKKKKKVKAERSAEDKSHSDSDEDEESESDWSDSSVSSFFSDDEQDRHKKAVAKWGIRTDDKKKKVSEKAEKQKKLKKSKKTKETTKVEGKLSAKEMEELFDTTDINAEVIQNRVQSIVEKRGRKGVDRIEQTRILKKLAEIAQSVNAQCHLQVVGHLISAEFDTTTGVFTCLHIDIWLETYKYLESILNTMESNQDVYLMGFMRSDDVNTLGENEEKTKTTLQKTNSAILTSFIERLDDELMKSLQLTDLHSDDYKERMGQIIMMLSILFRGKNFLQKNEHFDNASSITLRILEHMHYISDSLGVRVLDMVKKRLPENLASSISTEEPNSPSLIIEKLVKEIFEHGNKREKTRALLHLVYNKALHDNHHEAKDLLQTPNVHELAMQTDVQTQILYNRALVQLGLCAFRHGLVMEAHSCLTEIYAPNKHKELLAQAVSNLKMSDKTPEQERAEKRRLLPYHMHINLDLIEGAHNICAMLLEVPYMAANPFDIRKRQISRNFRKMLELYDRQVFLGPPENPRETIMAATKALQKGCWEECTQHVMNLNIWDKISNKEEVQEIYKKKIKQEAMKTYIFTYLTLYDSFSIDQLSSLFLLSKNDVHSIVSRMMVNEEIHASWDESSQCILINRVEPSCLQQLSMQLAVNIGVAIEQNEYTLNMKNPKFAALERRIQGRDGGGVADRYGWGGKGKDYRTPKDGGLSIGGFRAREGAGNRGFIPLSAQNRLQKNKGNRGNRGGSGTASYGGRKTNRGGYSSYDMGHQNKDIWESREHTVQQVFDY